MKKEVLEDLGVWGNVGKRLVLVVCPCKSAYVGSDRSKEDLATTSPLLFWLRCCFPATSPKLLSSFSEPYRYFFGLTTRTLTPSRSSVRLSATAPPTRSKRNSRRPFLCSMLCSAVSDVARAVRVMLNTLLATASHTTEESNKHGRTFEKPKQSIYYDPGFRTHPHQPIY